MNPQSQTQRRKVVKQKATRIQTFLDKATTTVTNTDIQLRIEKLEEIWHEFNEIQNEIESACTDEQLEAQDLERHNFETKHFKIRSGLLDLQKALHADNTSFSANPVTPTVVSTAEIKLPRLDLPNFSGNYQDWTSYYDLFLAIVHNNSSLTPVQKLHYLKSSLRGEAARLLHSVQVTDANYNEAWKILTERYENKRQIVGSHLRSLFGQSALHSESASGLRRLFDCTIEHVRALHVLGEPTEHWDSILVHLVSEKLDPDSRRQWELSLPTSELPKFNQLKVFLDQRCRALEASGCTKPKSNPNTSRQPQAKSSTSTYHSSVKASCIVCKSDHLIFHCPKFNQQTVAERTAFARQNSLCFNCLRAGHSSHQCKSSLCRSCNGRHHTLLHIEKTPVESTTPKNLHATIQQPPISMVSHCSNQGKEVQTQVLLSTAIVKVTDAFGQQRICRALLDSGSQSSFITEACTQRLGLRRTKASIPVHGIGNSGTEACRGMVHLELSSRFCNFTTTVDALILNNITGQLPNAYIDVKTWTFGTINLADPTFNQPGSVDLLLGADVFNELMLDGRMTGTKGSPSAQNTTLGWILSGKFSSRNTRGTPSSIVSNHALVDLSSQLKQFWEIEEVQTKNYLTPEEKKCEAHFLETHSRDSSGRYVVKLPFKDENLQLGNSKEAAITRFKQVEKRLEQSEERKQQYVQFMEEYLDLGHMEPVPDNEINKPSNEVFYLPHHAVMKESSSTTKLRVVFDGSAKTQSGVSLNDRLLVGPKIQDDLVDILLRFRLHEIAFAADIKKMYRQVQLHSDDTDFQRIVWRKSSTDELKEFRLTTVTYGTVSAPFLAVKSLQQLAHDKSVNFPESSQIILRDFYVDDLMSGAHDQHKALELQSQLTQLLERGGFKLHKWSSNDPALMEAVPPEDRETLFSFPINANDSIKTLGLHWHPSEDNFAFVVNISNCPDHVTKRTLLSDISRLFDPLGWMAPVIILAKILIQKLWLLGISWDEELPTAMAEYWNDFHNELLLLQDIRIKRCIVNSGHAELQLHGFSDASERAYAAVVYLRSTNSKDEVTVNLLCSKTRVAPVKHVSLPRLELCAAALLARLMRNVIKAIHFDLQSVHAWTDSTVVLSWISGLSSRWKTFVANRVSEIQSLIEPQHWKHVPSGDNPADCASRGLLPNKLKDHKIWWKGPAWLLSHPETWPKQTRVEDGKALKEQRSVKAFVTTNTHDLGLISRYSTLSKLQRVTAYCLRFIRNCKLPANERHFGSLTTDELNRSLMYWVKTVQSTEFAEQLHQLKTGNSLQKGSHLLTLNPFIDKNGLLRVGGRLKQSSLHFDQMHPILLPRKHPLTTLIISHEHERNLHAGPQLLLATLRQKFWIVNGRDVVRRHVKNCVKCSRLQTTSLEQIMGDLPAHRLEPVRPFLRTGVDYGGPFNVIASKGRGRKKTFKAYICLFVCLTTKAVHLELVGDLTTEAFIAAFKRFIARRGHCTDLYSDNGTNFVGAKRELRDLYKFVKSQKHHEQISRSMTWEGINWHLIPPSSPHFGGLWEAGIKSTKQHLRRVVGNASLTYEELYTILTQIEACLNSRPLCPMSSDPNDLSVLTPGHFLIGDALNSIPEQDLTHVKVNRLSRWQHVQKLAQHFWQRWQSEYLSRLQQRPKWASQQQQIKIGELVLIKDDNLPRLKWNLGRVTDTHPGKDGNTRVVSVKTANGMFKRPIVKLYPLPLEI